MAGHLVNENWVRFAESPCWNWAKGLYIVDCRMYIGGWNWVRFVFLVCGRVAVGVKLGSFRFFRMGQGGCGCKLGSFCIIRPDGSGEILNPKLEIQDKHEIRNMKLET